MAGGARPPILPTMARPTTTRPTGSTYRIVVGGPVAAQVGDAFPALRSQPPHPGRPEGWTELVGPVADPCQLAGIVGAICARNAEIISVERLGEG